MSFFSKLFAFKFLWLTALFNGMEKAYQELTDIEKDLSKKASIVIAVINQDLAAVPDLVFTEISKLLPFVTKEGITAELSDTAKFLGIADKTANLSFEEIIPVFQKYLSEVSGNGWVSKTTGAVNAFLTVILPTTTPIQKIAVVFEYVYQTFVKPLFVK